MVWCWCCFGLAPRTHSKLVACGLWAGEGTYMDRRLRRPPLSTLSQRQSAGSETHKAHNIGGRHRHTSMVLGRPLLRQLSELASCDSGLSLFLARATSRLVRQRRHDRAADHRRLSQHNIYKTRPWLVLLGGNFQESQQKLPHVQALLCRSVNTKNLNIILIRQPGVLCAPGCLRPEVAI